MGSNEDCASILEGFIQDANHPSQEIQHYLEEITAKDNELYKLRAVIDSRDASLQKHVRLNGSLSAHPKEAEFAETIHDHFGKCSLIQDQKIALSEKACLLLERQLKRLDMKIRELQSDGQLIDGPPLPSVFNRKMPEKSFAELPLASVGPLQPSSNSALNMNPAAHRTSSQVTAHVPAPVVNRQVSQVAGLSGIHHRSSAPATPSSAVQQQRTHRESSAGASDSKRRKLNPSFTASIPSQPSSLRQNSLGPSVTASGTPKAGTPTGTTATVRSGSLPRTTSSQQSAAAAAAKKAGAVKKIGPPHPLANKPIKGKPFNKHNTLLAKLGRKKGGSPSIRSRAGGSDDGDSVLSSAEVSDADSHVANKRGRRPKKEQEPIQAPPDEGEEEAGGEDDDNRRYCFCNEQSYGEMVACENEKCPYEWFHLNCVGMKKAPDDDEIWYCPSCRKEFNWDPNSKGNGKKLK